MSTALVRTSFPHLAIVPGPGVAVVAAWLQWRALEPSPVAVAA
jgi:hypothetical protein